jgi:hypothetical protein
MGRRVWVEAKLARSTVRSASVTVAPSRSMAKRIRETTGVNARVIPFGPGLVSSHRGTDGPFTFLHRTSWGPHKQLHTLLEAVRVLA